MRVFRRPELSSKRISSPFRAIAQKTGFTVNFSASQVKYTPGSLDMRRGSEEFEDAISMASEKRRDDNDNYGRVSGRRRYSIF